MARPKKIKAVDIVSVQAQVNQFDETQTITHLAPKIPIQPLTHEFGNGDMNILRDKINEIINS